MNWRQHYAGFVLSIGVGQAALNGFGPQFVWPHSAWWADAATRIALSAAGVMGLMFARDFLSSAVRMPRFDRLLRALLAGWVGSCAIAFVWHHMAYEIWLPILAIVSVGAMIAAGVISIRRDFAGAKYFFAAWASLLAGVLVIVLHNTGFLPSNAITRNALMVGSALEMVLLSFALANRINVARRFKEQATSRIAAEKALGQALAASQERVREVLEDRLRKAESERDALADIVRTRRAEISEPAASPLPAGGPAHPN
ncbi:MAG: 7TM diverse intracellular signaling domain-containing protein [Ramlibacter sp.]|uniref:7TM-DISM domain-containing protein n=1 Tax=Ramlibacter sp. TaxID=1917967 RepID=UPI003D1505E0